TPGAFQTTLSQCGTPPSPCQNAFVAKLNPSGTALVYATYLGGNGVTVGDGITVNAASGEAYIVGDTQAPDFPTSAGAPQTSLKGTNDLFVAHLNANGSALLFSTYFGGSGFETELSFSGVSPIAIDGSGGVYVTGSTTSNDLPTVSAFQP